MNYYPIMSASKNGFALKIHSRGALGSLVNWIFDAGPIGRLASFAARFRATGWLYPILTKPLTWSWVDGQERWSMQITPVDALLICQALDFDDRAMEFFWAMQVSIMWEEAREDGDDDIAVALKGLLASQGFDEMGERIHA